MDVLKEHEGEQKRLEKLILFVYTLYTIAMVVGAIKHSWAVWISAVMVLSMVAAWVIYIRKIKDYQFRARLITVLVECNLFLYSYAAEDLYNALPLQVAFAIFLGLYGIMEVVKITFFFSLALFCYHGIVMDTLSLNTGRDAFYVFLQVGNIVVVEGVVASWIRMRLNNDARILEIIRELRLTERSKDDFLANVSHEIRTPINTICGISEIILRDSLSSSVRDNVLNIQSAGQNLMSVVSDILDFSELQSGKMELEEEAYHISATLNDIVAMSYARKMEKKIELIIDCDANIPNTLVGDEKKIRRVIMNLVDNAIKFTEKGCVTIGVEFRKEEYGINLIVTIKDTGIGMEEEFLDKIFTRFHQVDASAKRAEGGLGLGLAITHALVRKMGGVITIKSRPERGTVVKVVIPQKVAETTPIAVIQKPSEVNVGIFIDLEQFGIMTIRDEYNDMIMHMVEGLKVRTHVCRNIAQLKRLEEKEGFSHVFTNLVEYRVNKAYFDELSERCKIIVVLDRGDEQFATNNRLLKVYKPFSVMSVAHAVNGNATEEFEYGKFSADKFVTRDTRVLVVDDNRMNIRVIAGLLEHYKMEVSVAYSGREALEKIETADFDFVFMDHMMPEMDGVETMHRIRKKVGEYYKKIPIVALTANAVAGTREMLLAEGFNDFLEKPIEGSVLERVLLRNLPGEKIVFEESAKEQKKAQEVPIYAFRDNGAQDNVQKDAQGAANPKLQAIGKLGVDIQKGVAYCGGEDGYLNILQGYCDDYEQSVTILNDHFAKKDWKNYTIMVHGIKSAMGSIGAVNLSEQARKLEAAGKADNVDYILSKHGELAEGYTRFFDELDKLGFGSGVRSKKEVVELPEIETQEFEQIVSQMETAMFELDQDTLEKHLKYLAGYQYHGRALTDIVSKALKKVEKSDFMSAVDMIAKQRKNP